MRRWIIVTLIFALTACLVSAHLEISGDVPVPEMSLEKQIEAANSVDLGNLTVGDNHVIDIPIAYKPNVYVYSLTREQQVELMAECVEDAVVVCKTTNTYPLTHWSKGEAKGNDTVILAAEIAVAFFNYRTGEK